MLKFYPYLFSSLLPLNFEAKPPYSFEEFLNYCVRFISEKETEILKNLSLDISFSKLQNPILEKWRNFNIALRNALLEFRASRFHKSFSDYIRESSFSYLGLKKDVYLAFQASAPDEQEKILDKLRWQFLEEEEKQHILNFGYIIVYGLKLLILLRWKDIRENSKQETLKEILEN